MAPETGPGGSVRDIVAHQHHVVLLLPSNAGLALGRAASRAGHRVSALALPTDATVLRSRHVRGHILTGGDSEWIEAILQMVDRAPALVFSDGDRNTAFLAQHRHELPGEVSTFEAPTQLHREFLDKEWSNAVARAAGVTVPWSRLIDSQDAAARLGEEITYPCIVKPVVSHLWRERFGLERVFLLRDASELEQVVQPAAEAGVDLTVSEFVPGGDDSVEEGIVVRREDGSYPVAFGCRKLRQYPVGFGAASTCVAAGLPETMAITRAVLDQAGFVGVAGVETKRHAITGERYFIEVNPRLVSQWGLGDACGVQASCRTIRLLAGEDVGPQPPLREGVKLIFPQLEIPAVKALLGGSATRRERLRTAAEILKSYRGARDFGIIDLRDPEPALAHLMSGLRRRARRAVLQ
jgi:predicted ATP-grasp superfamily ATP-dependent carboligase